ncbi:uncharacterized protein [Anoplolepis gracilipes]|uniref:uncharacterized protein n=1 Tax=Anoplolepis gracilipes TaxID=354296 RepID=UPI003BA15AAD
MRTEATISFAFDGNMSLLIILFSVSVLLHCCVLGVSDEHRKLTSDALDATNKMNAPLTPLPKNEARQFQENYHIPSLTSEYRHQKCPLCDSSVYPYCGEKLLHDACCCADSYDLPYQCKLADCRFLHANSCREHRLIANCCCSDDYRAVLRSFARR